VFYKVFLDNFKTIRLDTSTPAGVIIFKKIYQLNKTVVPNGNDAKMCLVKIQKFPM